MRILRSSLLKVSTQQISIVNTVNLSSHRDIKAFRSSSGQTKSSDDTLRKPDSSVLTMRGTTDTPFVNVIPPVKLLYASHDHSPNGASPLSGKDDDMEKCRERLLKAVSTLH